VSDHPAGQVPAKPSGGGAGTQLCVLLTCFAGSKTAARVRAKLNKGITGGRDAILDEVVVRIDAKHKVTVYDPRRTIAGIVVPAVTWGVFGLLAGGVRGLGVWAILGAVCGGLYAYLTEHLLTKDELKRIGGQMPGNASAIVAFVQAADPRRVLSAAAPYQPTAASAAAIGGDLSARVYGGASGPVETSSTPAGERVPLRGNTMLNMLLLRYRGNDTARRQVARARSASLHREQGVQTELVFEAPEHGRLKVSDPSQGVAAMSKSDVISWGLFGLAWGAIAGFSSNSGVLSSIKSGLVTGILWALFGLVAGALYGLWAGRAVSARRLKGVSPLLPPDTSAVLAWSEGNLTQQAIDSWSAPGSQRLTLRFNPAGDGVLLEV
jgi:uncharacterized membrane protein